MGKNHLKRINAPRNWKLKRKERKWIARPMPGAHPLNACLTLDIIARDVLNLGKTAREINFIISNKEISVDKKPRTDKKFAVGLMDVVEILKLGQKFRVVYNKKGELKLANIDGKEASQKLLKIKKKTKIANGRIQLGFHDGRTIAMDKCENKVGDSALFDLEKKNIIKFIPLEQGATVLITKGKNIGTIGTIKEISNGGKLSKVMCIVEAGNEKLSTFRDHVFVIGKGKPETTVGEDK